MFVFVCIILFGFLRFVGRRPERAAGRPGLSQGTGLVAGNGSCRRERILAVMAMRKISSVGAERSGFQAQ